MMNAAIPAGLLARWRLNVASPDVIQARGGFSGASVCRVETSDGVFALRCWPEGSAGLPVERIRELHRWLQSLVDAGINFVAVPRPSVDGMTLVELGGRLWQLEPWLPGVADFWANPSDARLRGAFAALARLHRAAKSYEPTDSGAEWFSSGVGKPAAVTERLTKLRQLARDTIASSPGLIGVSPQQQELTVRLTTMALDMAPRVAAELAGVAAVRVPLQPVLRDVWHDHVLFSGDEVTGIIDPSATRTESVASDLSRLLGSLLGNDHTRWNTALDAYAAIRPLSADEWRLIPVLDRSGVVLSAVHWLERMRSRELNDDEWSRVESIAERLLHFA